MLISKRWRILMAGAMASRAAHELPAEPYPPNAVVLDPHVVRVDATHITLSGAPCFRVEASRVSPYVPARFTYYDFGGRVVKLYVCGEVTLELLAGSTYSIAWYGSEAFDAPPLGSLRISAIAADFNLDGGITIEDLLTYLALYDAGDLRADLDDGLGHGRHDGGVGIEDLLYFQRAFDAGGNTGE